MSELTVRRLPFEFDGVRFMWNPSHRGFSVWANAISYGSVGFETWLVRVMREVQPLIRDPEIALEAKHFTEQEAVHAAAHAKHVTALADRYPGLAGAKRKVIDHFDQWRQEASLETNMCAIAALESTFTPSFKMIIDNRRVLMGDGDARVASLLLWHFCEEIEHRSSALRIYRHVYGNPFGPLRLFPEFRRRVRGFFAMMRDEFRQHVPRDESSTQGQRAFSRVPRLHKWVAASRISLSQTPWHRPDREPLPPWSHKWFAAYRRGVDMTQFYGRPQEGLADASPPDVVTAPPG